MQKGPKFIKKICNITVPPPTFRDIVTLLDPGFVCLRCRGLARPIDGHQVTEVVGDKTLDVVDKFCYLCNTLCSVGGCRSLSAIIKRCKDASGKFRKLLPILTSRKLYLLVRSRGYNSCVQPSMGNLGPK